MTIPHFILSELFLVLGFSLCVYLNNYKEKLFIITKNKNINVTSKCMYLI